MVMGIYRIYVAACNIDYIVVEGEKMIVYISGSVTNTNDYKQRFETAKIMIEQTTHDIPICPITLCNYIPEGITDLNGNRQGLWKEYYETGELRSIGKYKDSKMIGEWKLLYPNQAIVTGKQIGRAHV